MYVTWGCGGMAADKKNPDYAYKVCRDLYAYIYKFVCSFVREFVCNFHCNLYTNFVWCMVMGCLDDNVLSVTTMTIFAFFGRVFP